MVKGLQIFKERMVGGLPVIGADRLIPLKVRAWLDLDARRSEGQAIDVHDVRKHRNDILRLSRVIDPSVRVEAPDSIKADIEAALRALAIEPSLDLRSMGLKSTTLVEVIGTIRHIYGLK